MATSWRVDAPRICCTTRWSTSSRIRNARIAYARIWNARIAYAGIRNARITYARIWNARSANGRTYAWTTDARLWNARPPYAWTHARLSNATNGCWCWLRSSCNDGCSCGNGRSGLHASACSSDVLNSSCSRESYATQDSEP